jgi:hypothetical protein
METAYIQFEAPKDAVETGDKSSFKHSIKNLAITILTKIFPVANPDFEDKIDDVKYWLVECDVASGAPEREIGIDENGRVILKMPYKENCGSWTDNNLLLKDFKEHFEVREITKEDFEQKWVLFDKISNF